MRVPSFGEHQEVGLGPLLPLQAFILGSQELDADRGPLPWGLSAGGAFSHEARSWLPEVGQGRARAGQPFHPDPGEKQTLRGEAGGRGGRERRGDQQRRGGGAKGGWRAESK